MPVRCPEYVETLNRKMLNSILFFCIAFFSAFSAFGQSTDTTHTILLKPKEASPYKRLIGDTVSTEYDKHREAPKPGAGDEHYTPEQDSAFARAMRLRIANDARFMQELRVMMTLGTTRPLTEFEKTELAIQRNLDIPPGFLAPSQQDLTLYQYNIMQSQRVIGVNNVPLGKLALSLNSIGKFFGIVEDLSPEIKYDLDFTVDVEVVVYSISAKVIATVFKGVQSPGSYKLTWNKRDSKGKLMPSGDYIAEVRIGKVRTVRKRIQID